MPLAGSVLRSIAPDRQRQAKSAKTGLATWAELIELTKARIDIHLADTQSALYRVLQDARDSANKIRSDGLPNLASVLHVLVGHSDKKTGFIADGRPGKNLKRWTLEDLDKRAFGEPVHGERSIVRTQRWASTCRAAGILEVRQVAEDRNGVSRALPAVRLLTHKLYALLGLEGEVKAVRRNMATALETRWGQRPAGRQRPRRKPHRDPNDVVRPPATPGVFVERTGPPTRETTAIGNAEVAKINEFLRRSGG